MYNAMIKKDATSPPKCSFSISDWRTIISWLSRIRKYQPNLFRWCEISFNEVSYPSHMFEDAVYWAGKKYIYQLTKQDFQDYLDSLEEH